MSLASSMLFSLGHGISARPDVIVAVSALLVTIILWLIDHRRKRRRISYRVHMNTQIGAMPDIRGTGDFVVRSNNKEVPDRAWCLFGSATAVGSILLRMISRQRSSLPSAAGKSSLLRCLKQSRPRSIVSCNQIQIPTLTKWA